MSLKTTTVPGVATHNHWEITNGVFSVFKAKLISNFDTVPQTPLFHGSYIGYLLLAVRLESMLRVEGIALTYNG